MRCVGVRWAAYPGAQTIRCFGPNIEENGAEEMRNHKHILLWILPAWPEGVQTPTGQRALRIDLGPSRRVARDRSASHDEGEYWTYWNEA